MKSESGFEEGKANLAMAKLVYPEVAWRPLNTNPKTAWNGCVRQRELIFNCYCDLHDSNEAAKWLHEHHYMKYFKYVEEVHVQMDKLYADIDGPAEIDASAPVRAEALWKIIQGLSSDNS